MASAWTVLLVDDHPVMRMGLRMLLEPTAKFAVCGEAANVGAARQMAEELRPDFVVLDLLLGGRDGMELISDITAAHASAMILIYSSQDELRYARRALQAGARGYVSKEAGLPEVLTGLEAIARGELHVSAVVQRAWVTEVARGNAVAAGDRLDCLSNRELQVFRLLGSGMDTDAVAVELKLSAKTVGTYRERLKDKLGPGECARARALRGGVCAERNGVEPPRMNDAAKSAASARPAKDGVEWREFRDEITASNLRRMWWLMIVGVVLELLVAGANFVFTLPAHREIGAHQLVDAGLLAIMMPLVAWARRRPGRTRLRRVLVVSFSVLLLLNMTAYFFHMLPAYGITPDYILGPVIVGALVLMPPLRLIGLLLANHALYVAVLL